MPPRQSRNALALTVVLMLSLPSPSDGQESQKPPATPPEAVIDDTIEAGEAGGEKPRRSLVKWNEYEGPWFTIRLGAGVLFDYAAYAQDDGSRQQFDLASEADFRDARFLLSGRFKFRRPVTWSAGIMYNGPTDEWLFRETGVMVAVPELWGHIFVGRTKEGFSLNKVMTGYAGWTMERATVSDATIPILADGIKWLGYAPKIGLLWNLGLYGDWLSEDQTFSTYDRQVVGRLAWVPSVTRERLLHVGMSARYGKPDEGSLRLRSRPEMFLAPYFVDTGAFEADSSKMLASEVYYRPGSLLLGSEYFVQKVNAPQAGDPWFHGGDAVVSWLLTGETRAYNTRGGFFNQVSPARTVFEGGPGAWELIARFSYVDLDAAALRGGKLWRFTPMVNWHLSDNLRLEIAYGYSSLDRFDLTGATQFFQSRIQLKF